LPAVFRRLLRAKPRPARQKGPKSIFAHETVIDFIVRKYCDALPLYRQRAILMRALGIDVGPTTIDDVVLRVGELLIPVVDTIKRDLLTGGYIQADDRGPHGQVFVRGVEAGSRLRARSRLSSVRMSRSRSFLGRVGLHQSPPPLHRMRLECSTVVLPVERFAANGNVGLNCLSQPRGQPQWDSRSNSQGFFDFASIVPATCSPE
jgi:hypothetical protein